MVAFGMATWWTCKRLIILGVAKFPRRTETFVQDHGAKTTPYPQLEEENMQMPMAAESEV